VSSPALDLEPACPASDQASAENRPDSAPLRVERRSISDIPRETWDALASRNPWSTPFSGWAFQRASWDGYGANAHQDTLAIVPGDAPVGGDPIAIVPLMHRHEMEPGDELVHTSLRRGGATELTPVEPTATAVFFGASYHADYATVLTAPADLPAVSAAIVDHLAQTDGHRSWDVVDLRRLRCGDPTADALATAFGAREMREGWTLNVEREDVCPVVELPVGGTMDDYLAGLGKKQRHEIRRKVRRAEAVGEVRLIDSTDPIADLPMFIDMHQKKWAGRGLFPDTPGGEQSLVFARRLFELHGPDGRLRLAFLTIGGRRVAAGIHFLAGDRILYYNAGVDPDARDLSPGVVMIHSYVARALAGGIRQLDFLRGDESYKYDWGAHDEPIQRLLVRRRSLQA
jgi:CelD/BcsL family acetyltransferase involved in cellulose biosynthesis